MDRNHYIRSNGRLAPGLGPGQALSVAPCVSLPFAPGSEPGQVLNVAPSVSLPFALSVGGISLRSRRVMLQLKGAVEFILSQVEGLSTNGGESKGELCKRSPVTVR